MNWFEKSIIGLVGASCASMMYWAATSTADLTTHSPQAAFLPPEAVPEVVAAGVGHFETQSGGAAAMTVSSLSKALTRIDYDLDPILTGDRDVPRLFVSAIPRDMPRIRVVEKRKELFFKLVLPLVLQVNEEIRSERRRLLSIMAHKTKTGTVLPVDRLWLSVISEKYKVSSGNLNTLLARIDIIPPSLALAQAAEESGWGTSRFVLHGNALFGQWTYSKTGGMVPKDRDAGKTHRIKLFETLLDGVRAYAKNLNSHRAYREFRARRADLRHQDKPMDGHALAETLHKYSQRGDKYVGSLRAIIRANDLQKVDRVKLSDRVDAALTADAGSESLI